MLPMRGILDEKETTMVLPLNLISLNIFRLRLLMIPIELFLNMI